MQLRIGCFRGCSTFEKALGNKLGGVYTRSGERVAGTVGGPTITAPIGEGSSITADTAALSAAGTGGADSLVNFNAIGATSGIGILRETTSGVLKVQLEALQNEGLTKIISNPKLFSLNNQAASITQGVQIQVPGSGDSPVTFKDAALKLQVTPNIIGDGNVLLEVQVNNDTPDRTNPGAIGINKLEILTKLLVADGDIVVIGGIKKNDISQSRESIPGVNKLPIVGKLFQGKADSDTMSELLVFIAPRVL